MSTQLYYSQHLYLDRQIRYIQNSISYEILQPKN